MSQIHEERRAEEESGAIEETQEQGQQSEVIELAEAYSIKSGLVMISDSEDSGRECLKDVNFYGLGVAYILSRVALNLIAIATPLYLINITMFTGKTSAATPPLIAAVPLFAFGVSMLAQTMMRGREGQ